MRLKTPEEYRTRFEEPEKFLLVLADELAHVIEDRFFEVFNGYPDRMDSNHERIWDIANTIQISELKQPPLFGLATDDSHIYTAAPSPPGVAGHGSRG